MWPPPDSPSALSGTMSRSSGDLTVAMSAKPGNKHYAGEGALNQGGKSFRLIMNGILLIAPHPALILWLFHYDLSTTSQHNPRIDASEWGPGRRPAFERGVHRSVGAIPQATGA
jgi:hypothetical protein